MKDVNPGSGFFFLKPDLGLTLTGLCQGLFVLVIYRVKVNKSVHKREILREGICKLMVKLILLVQKPWNEVNHLVKMK